MFIFISEIIFNLNYYGTAIPSLTSPFYHLQNKYVTCRKFLRNTIHYLMYTPALSYRITSQPTQLLDISKEASYRHDNVSHSFITFIPKAQLCMVTISFNMTVFISDMCRIRNYTSASEEPSKIPQTNILFPSDISRLI